MQNFKNLSKSAVFQGNRLISANFQNGGQMVHFRVKDYKDIT